MNLFSSRKYEQAYREGLSFTTLTNQEGKSLLLIRMGDLEYELTNYAAALDACTLPLEEARILSKISWVYQILGNWEQALEYEEKALELCKNLNLDEELAFRLHQLGNIHQNKYHYGETLHYFNESLELKQKTAEYWQAFEYNKLHKYLIILALNDLFWIWNGHRVHPYPSGFFKGKKLAKSQFFPLKKP